MGRSLSAITQIISCLIQETPLGTILNKLKLSKLEPLPTLISILRKIFKGTLLGRSYALTKKSPEVVKESPRFKEKLQH